MQGQSNPAGGEDLLADFASKSDLAQRFEVSERTIERWVRMRVLPQPVRLGRTSLFHLPSVQDHLLRRASHRTASRLRKS